MSYLYRRMQSIFVKILAIFFLVIPPFLLVACGGSSNGLTGNFTEYSYNGSGGYTANGQPTNWVVQFNTDANFAAIETVSQTVVQGTYSRDPVSAFDIINITSANQLGSGAAPTNVPAIPSGGLKILALEVPGIAFVMQPILSGETGMITAVLSGNCPGQNLPAQNYIYTQLNATDDLTATTKGFFGTLVFTQSTGTTTNPTYFSLTSGFPSATTPIPTMSNVCYPGTGTSTYQNATEYVYQLSSFMKFSNGDNSGLISLPAAAIPTFQALISPAGYAGLVFDGSNNTVFPIQTTIPATATTSASLTLSNVNLTDYVTPTTTYQTMNLTLSLPANLPSPGFVTGTIGSGNVVCIGESNFGGKDSLFCLGQNPAANSKPVVIVMVSH